MSVWTTIKRWLAPAPKAPPPPAPAADRVAELREALKEARAERLLNVVRLGRSYVGADPFPARLTEAQTDYWLAGYVDLLDRYRDGMDLVYPLTQPTDRRYGSNYPLWTSESQLSLLRAMARLLAATNTNAQGLLNGLTSYVVGTGFKFGATPKKATRGHRRVARKVRAAIDAFTRQTDWAGVQQELYWRTRRDGEAFVRLFRDQPDGLLALRFVEPEQVFQPPDSTLDDWSYGIRTPPDDVCRPLAYHVSYYAPHERGQESGDRGELEFPDSSPLTPDPSGFSDPSPLSPLPSSPLGEIVPAEDVVHVRVNVDRTVKRGLSDFAFDTLDSLTAAARVRRNTAEGAAAQAAIAAVRQHESAPQDQVQEFTQASIDYAIQSPAATRPESVQRLPPGSFLDIPKGMTYVPPPGAENMAAHLEVALTMLKTAGVRHNAPPWLLTADAGDTNYASSLTAESPFVKGCEAQQATVYLHPFTRIVAAAVDEAARAGRVPADWRTYVDLTGTPPEVRSRDPAAEASANKTYHDLGVKSRETIRHELGLDARTEDRRVRRERAEDAKRGVQPGGPPPAGGGGGPPAANPQAGYPPRPGVRECVEAAGKTDANGKLHAAAGSPEGGQFASKSGSGATPAKPAASGATATPAKPDTKGKPSASAHAKKPTAGTGTRAKAKATIKGRPRGGKAPAGGGPPGGGPPAGGRPPGNGRPTRGGPAANWQHLPAGKLENAVKSELLPKGWQKLESGASSKDETKSADKLNQIRTHCQSLDLHELYAIVRAHGERGDAAGLKHWANTANEIMGVRLYPKLKYAPRAVSDGHSDVHLVNMKLTRDGKAKLGGDELNKLVNVLPGEIKKGKVYTRLILSMGKAHPNRMGLYAYRGVQPASPILNRHAQANGDGTRKPRLVVAPETFADLVHNNPKKLQRIVSQSFESVEPKKYRRVVKPQLVGVIRKKAGDGANLVKRAKKLGPKARKEVVKTIAMSHEEEDVATMAKTRLSVEKLRAILAEKEKDEK